MSFIVKGIDLPKDGESMRLVITSSGDVIEVWGSGLAKMYHPRQAVQIPKGHGRLKDFDGDGIHPIIIDGIYMVKVDDLDEMPTILEAEE